MISMIIDKTVLMTSSPYYSPFPPPSSHWFVAVWYFVLSQGFVSLFCLYIQKIVFYSPPPKQKKTTHKSLSAPLHTNIRHGLCFFVINLRVLSANLRLYSSSKFPSFHPPRYESRSSGEKEIQRTMLELLNQLDGFDDRGDVKVGGWLIGNF